MSKSCIGFNIIDIIASIRLLNKIDSHFGIYSSHTNGHPSFLHVRRISGERKLRLSRQSAYKIMCYIYFLSNALYI